MLPIGSIFSTPVSIIVTPTADSTRASFESSTHNPLKPTQLDVDLNEIRTSHEPNVFTQTNVNPYYVNSHPSMADTKATHDVAFGLRTPAAANSMSKIGMPQNRTKNNCCGGGAWVAGKNGKGEDQPGQEWRATRPAMSCPQ